MDRLDLDIIKDLQENARISTAELARKIGLSTSATSERISKLEREGIIKGYSAVIDAGLLGQVISAFILVPVGSIPIDTMAADITAIPQVQECHKVTGNACFMVKVRTGSMTELERVIDAINHAAPNTCSYLVLSTLKESAQVNINNHGEV